MGVSRDRLILSIDRESGVSCQSPIGHGLFGIASFVVMVGQLQGKLVGMIARYGFQCLCDFSMQHTPFTPANFVIKKLLGQCMSKTKQGEKLFANFYFALLEYQKITLF